jgi:hypothetical protein
MAPRVGRFPADAILIFGTLHFAACACGGYIATKGGRGEYPRATKRHHKTAQHRDWADGPRFRQWQNQATLKGQN